MRLNHEISTFIFNELAYIRNFTRMHMCVYVYVWIYMYTHVYIYTNVYTHIYKTNHSATVYKKLQREMWEYYYEIKMAKNS